MADVKVGTVTHYYDKIQVAIIEVEDDLSLGDQVKFVRNGEDLLEQEVESMEYEHEKVESAKKGETVGLKVVQEVKEGAEVFRVES